MVEEVGGLRGYTVRVAAMDGDAERYAVTYSPRHLRHERGAGGRPKPLPNHRAEVRTGAASPIKWREPPTVGDRMLELEDDARTRVRLLHGWLRTLHRLIASVRGWAEELGWSVKSIDKPMEDSAIGQYRAPVLLMQEGVTKVLLEPVARLAPGAEGVVDLYLMPGYDDIASLYYDGNRWNVHYMGEGSEAAATVREAVAKPLTKASLRKVLDELKSHVG